MHKFVTALFVVVRLPCILPEKQIAEDWNLFYLLHHKYIIFLSYLHHPFQPKSSLCTVHAMWAS